MDEEGGSVTARSAKLMMALLLVEVDNMTGVRGNVVVITVGALLVGCFKGLSSFALDSHLIWKVCKQFTSSVFPELLQICSRPCFCCILVEYTFLSYRIESVSWKWEWRFLPPYFHQKKRGIEVGWRKVDVSLWEIFDSVGHLCNLACNKYGGSLASKFP